MISLKSITGAIAGVSLCAFASPAQAALKLCNRTSYVLYAASNLGGLLALLAYPLIVEPGLTLHAQRWSWSGGYVAFIVLIATLAVAVIRAGGAQAKARQPAAKAPPAARPASTAAR